MTQVPPVKDRIKRSGSGEEGVIVVFLAILVLAFVIFIALVVDIGRIMATQRQLMNAADTAALTAANQFRLPMGHPVSNDQIVQWKRAKKAVLASLGENQIFGCNTRCKQDLANGAARFSLGANTVCDDRDYRNEEAQIGNLNVIMRRGVFCRSSGSGRRYFFSLENAAAVQYCRANAVHVWLRLDNVATTFGKIIRAENLGSRAESEAYVTPDVRSCFDDDCASFGTFTEDVAAGTATFNPFVCPGCGCPGECTAGCPSACCGTFFSPVCTIGCPECSTALCGFACS